MKLEIVDLSREGNGVARADGKVIFVPLAIPGDVVEVRITRDEGRYAEAELTEIIEKSSDRVEPPCRVFGQCGGCTLQHLPYLKQWELKKKGVLQALAKARVETAGVELREFPAPFEYSYRNRIQLRQRGSELGFFKRKSRELVSIDRCEIALEVLNEKLASIPPSFLEAESKIELDYHPETGVRIAVNRPHAAFGFRQVNDAQNEQMKKWVASALSGFSGHLYDLYGGSGNLSIPVASQFSSVDVVDVSVPGSSAISHLKFHRSDVMPWLKKAAQSARKPAISLTRVAIMDPPREGLKTTASSILESLVTLGVERVVLISCDVDSYARDTSNLIKSGFQLQEMALFDFFPQTPHLESAAVFVRG